MNPQEQNQAPKEKSFGATIAIIVIIIVIVVGALYLWGGQVTSQNSAPIQPNPTSAATTTTATSTVSTTVAPVSASTTKGK